MYRGGTPDVWYSGTSSDLWVEYKWIDRVPLSVVVPDATSLQLGWLIGRQNEGRNVALAVGHPNGIFVSSEPGDWIEVETRDFLARSVSRDEWIGWLIEELG